MDKIRKFLAKLSKKELLLVQSVLEQLYGGDVKNVDIKKLKGYKDVYRVRIQNIRVIFTKKHDDILLLEVSRRNESTYRDY